MSIAAGRHLARLAGYPAHEAPDQEELARAVATRPDRVVAGLVAEALASDDVTSGADARAFVTERLTEWDDLLPDELRERLASAAAAEIQRRAPA